MKPKMIKVRVVVNGDTTFYTTVSEIVDLAVYEAWCALKFMRDTDGVKPRGLTGHWRGKNVQIDLVD
jgi:hypothetical protein